MSSLVKAAVDALLTDIAQDFRMVLQVESLVLKFENPPPQMNQLVSRLKESVMESIDLIHAMKAAVLQHEIVATHKATEEEDSDEGAASDDSVEEVIPGPDDILMPLVEAMGAAEEKAMEADDANKN